MTNVETRKMDDGGITIWPSSFGFRASFVILVSSFGLMGMKTMALTGLQIQKLLPKTNCKECGCNTCLAFAMKLAAKKAELAECPYASDEAKAILGAAAEPPIRTVVVGSGERVLKGGGETVLFRHERTFVNQTGLGLAIDDTLADDEIDRRVTALRDYRLERVGEVLRPDVVSVGYRSGKTDRFLAVCAKAAELWDGPLAVRTDNAGALRAAAEKLRGRRPLLASATTETAVEMAKVAKDNESVLAVAANDFDTLVATVARVQETGLRDLLLELRADSLCEDYQNRTLIRRGALKAGLKTLGYPILRYVDTGDCYDDAVEAALGIAKYASLVVLPSFDPAVWAPLLTLRQNLYTDPQKPIQVEPGIHTIGEPNDHSPSFVTTNFSLTYFLVSSEIENAGVSAWLVVPECEGLSVMTAWAAGKFGGDKIGAFAKAAGLEQHTTNRKLVIPGYVSQISGELEDAMPGWQVIVGPQEAGDIESFVKNVPLG
jgi:acetyl-CoA decarbonylase/synthase, CODH/ACS complex subunit gamma